MIEEKINIFLNAPDDAINLGDIHKMQLNEPIHIFWGDESIGYLTKGLNIFSPKVEIINTEFLESDKKILITKKLQQWIDLKISTTLKPIKDELDKDLSSDVRALAFNLFNALGSMIIGDHFSIIKNMTQKDKIAISKLGVRIGAKFFYMVNNLKKAPMELSAKLWRAFYLTDIKEAYPLPKDGRVSFASNNTMPEHYWSSIGYHCIDNFAVRVDVFERVFFLARQKIKYGPFIESSDMMNPIGCNSQQLTNILKFSGFDNATLGNEKKIFFIKLKAKHLTGKKIIKTKKKIIKTSNKKTSKKQKIQLDPNSPFAVLEKLL